MTGIHGKTAIITGASSGIGAASAFLFAKDGANLVLSGRNETALARVADAITQKGGQAVFLAGNVKDEAYHAALMALTTERFGGLDIAFNNAGETGKNVPLAELALDDFSDCLTTNLTAAFLAAKHQIPAMVERGGVALVFTSSFVGYSAGFPGMAAYAAAKAGLIGLVQVIASEYAAKGIRANALLPGGIDTPCNAANQPGADAGLRGFIEGLHALKRLGRPEEIAEAALFLASPAASFITGAALLADGGLSISKI